MVGHNNEIPHQHFHKVCQQDHIRTWFNQPARKKSRRLARQKKAAAMAPRPTAGLLRPVVHPSSQKYNYKLRQGRGFTFAELKEAGINKKEARTIGISVDHRRRNRSAESLQLNVQRLKEYKTKLIVFPRKRGKPKAGDADAAELEKASQLKGEILPMPSAAAEEAPMTITKEMKEFGAFHKIRMARADFHLFGIRQKNRLAKESKDN
jgi:large subunit ribosomal protein L13e